MYKDQLVLAVKVNGKILRETKDLVKLPFGSEFSILVKNLHSRRVQFTLHIDGTDALEGGKLVVNGNSEIEVKRFIRNGNMEEGNAFKFIERTQQIEDGPRGIKVDDGIIRVEYWFEKEKPVVNHVYTHYHPIYYNGPYWYYPPYYYPSYWTIGTSYGGGQAFTTTTTSGSLVTNGIASGSTQGIYASNSNTTGTASINAVNTSGSVLGNINSAEFSSIQQDSAASVGSFASNSCVGSTTESCIGSSMLQSNESTMDSSFVNDVGITVPGSKVQQTFSHVFGFDPEEISHVIILRLVGMVGKLPVSKPVTVKSKQKCEICGKVNKATSSYCSGCGAALEIV